MLSRNLGTADDGDAKVRVLSAVGGQLIGEVINASQAGLLIVSARAFTDQTRTRLRLEAGDASGRFVEVTVEAIYCEPSRFSDRYGVGFAIVETHAGNMQSLFPRIGQARFGISA